MPRYNDSQINACPIETSSKQGIFEAKYSILFNVCTAWNIMYTVYYYDYKYTNRKLKA